MMMATLTRKGVYEKDLTIRLPADEEVVIGRKYCNILRHGERVSSKHAVMFNSGSHQWFIKDTSESGVFVNCKKIPKGFLHEVQDNDSIGLGVFSGTCEKEFVFEFQTLLPKKPCANKKVGNCVIQSGTPAVQNPNTDDCDDVVIISERHLLNSCASEDDSLSDTISNNDSCIYLTDAEDDNPETAERNTIPTIPVSDSRSDAPTTVVPIVEDQVQKNLKCNISENQCQDVCNGTSGKAVTINGTSGKAVTINGTSGKAVTINGTLDKGVNLSIKVSDVELCCLQQQGKESPVVSEKEVLVASLKCDEKREVGEIMNHAKKSEVICNGSTNESRCIDAQELNADVKQSSPKTEIHGENCIESNLSIVKETNACAEEKLFETEIHGENCIDNNLNVMKEINVCLEEKISETEVHGKDCVDNVVCLQTKEKCHEVHDKVVSDDSDMPSFGKVSGEQNNCDISPPCKASKTKAAKRGRKRTRLTMKKTSKKKNAMNARSRKVKKLQEELHAEKVASKFHELKNCSVSLYRLNTDSLINGSCIVNGTMIQNCKTQSHRFSSPHKTSCSGLEKIKDVKIPKFKSCEISSKDEFQESDELGRSKSEVVIKHGQPELERSNKKFRTSFTVGKTSKLLRNYCLLLKMSKYTDITPSEKCEGRKNASRQKNQLSSSVLSGSVAATKSSPSVSCDQEVAETPLPVMAKSKGTKNAPNKTCKKRTLKIPPSMNKQPPKRSNSVPASVYISANLKKFVIPKRKATGETDSVTSTATTGLSQKLSEKQITTNKAPPVTQSHARSELKTFTIPKRKTSVDDCQRDEKSAKGEHYQERSRSFADAYGNSLNRKGDAARRHSEEDCHSHGSKRINQEPLLPFPVPSKRVAATQREGWEAGSYVPSNNFPHPTSQYNMNVNSNLEGFYQPPMPRDQNYCSFLQVNHVNIISNSDAAVAGCFSAASPPVHKNVSFMASCDQMQSKVNALDPRVFRGERSSFSSTYNRFGPDDTRAQIEQIQDMDVCELDNSNCLIDYAQNFNSGSIAGDARHLLPTDQNIACNHENLTASSDSKRNRTDSVASSSENGQNNNPSTPEDCERTQPNTNYCLPIRIPSPPVFSELTTGITVESVLQQILSWNVNWLQEQKTSSRPPPVTLGDLKKLQLSYFTFDVYVNLFLPLILLETWQLLFTTWCNSKNDEPLNFIITNSSEDNGSIVLDCQSVTTSVEVPHFPKEGKVLIFEVASKYGKKSRVFGLVMKQSVEKKASHEISEELQCLHRISPNISLLLVRFSVKIKKKEVNLFLNKLMKAQVTYYLRPQLHVIRSVLELPKSPLVKTVLMPKKSQCEILLTGESNISAVGSYNRMQVSLILGMCKAVVSRDQGPQIISIHGPPGTGKTHIILGVLQHLLKSYSYNVKVLVTASSDAAINEIGYRLRALEEYIGGWKNRLILIGTPDKCVKTLIPYTLKELSKRFALEHKQNIKRIEEHEADIQLEIAAMQQSITDMKERSLSPSEIRKAELDVHNKLKDQIAVRAKLKVAVDEWKEISKNEKSNLRSLLLKNAAIVLCTLNNSRQLLMEDSSTGNYCFTCCIVDEATQSVEPEVLQPFIYGMDKVLLFGDKYLPPVIQSKVALDYNYELSLSERLHSYFVENFETSPSIILNQQYRMDPEIFSFPSKFFYSNMHTSSSSYRSPSFPLTPYVLLNTVKLNNMFKATGSPSLEQIIVRLCKELLRLIRQKYNIGVILPSSEQCKTLPKVVARHLDVSTIDINVVDFFQSQEKDVIILPCSTSDGENCGKGYLTHKHKLAIALTRARSSLIILGNFETMKMDSNLEALINDAGSRALCQEVDSLDDFPQLIHRTK